MLMAISRTPYRVSFFGGGTDYPAWYRRHGGAVLSMAINKYCYIGTGFMPPFFGIRHRIIWSHIEAVGAISEILEDVAAGFGFRVSGHRLEVYGLCQDCSRPQRRHSKLDLL